MTLAEVVSDHESFGCRRADGCLGIQRMPEGFALMIDADDAYFYWLAADGAESAVHWNKWAVWRGARKRAAMAKELQA